ncbi:MAG: hypothetical protein R3C19_06655 [Planctomycetaceae bacterium]
MIRKTIFVTALAVAVLGLPPADAAVISISLSNPTLSPTARYSMSQRVSPEIPSQTSSIPYSSASSTVLRR